MALLILSNPQIYELLSSLRSQVNILAFFLINSKNKLNLKHISDAAVVGDDGDYVSKNRP